MAGHPKATGLVVAVLVGWCGWNAYQTGLALGRASVLAGLADDARLASEALGG